MEKQVIAKSFDLSTFDKCYCHSSTLNEEALNSLGYTNKLDTNGGVYLVVELNMHKRTGNTLHENIHYRRQNIIPKNYQLIALNANGMFFKVLDNTPLPYTDMTIEEISEKLKTNVRLVSKK